MLRFHVLALFVLGSVPFAQEALGSLDRDVTVLDVSGEPYARGLAHGRALKGRIHDMVGEFKADLSQTHGVPADEFIERFLADTDFQPAIERWVPGLMDEVRGIANGAGIPFETMFVFNLLDEEHSDIQYFYASRLTGESAGGVEDVHLRPAEPRAVQLQLSWGF